MRRDTKRVGRAMIMVLAAAFLAAALVVGCEGQQEGAPAGGSNSPAGQGNTVPVEVVEVKAETFTETARAVGTLRALATVEVRPEVTGILKEIHFEEGERVSEDSLLFSIDDRKLIRELRERQEALNAAKAQVENAHKEFERTERLIETRAVSQAEKDRTQAALKTAQAEVGQAEAAIELIEERLKDTKIRAPFSGVTTECMVDCGDYVTTGDRLVTLHTLSPIEMSAKIPERYMGRVRSGQHAAVLVDAYPDRRFSGPVSFISPEVDERTRNFLVKITLDNEEGLLKPGGFATAVLTLRTLENRPAVPEEALVATTEGYMVYVVEDGVARKRSVEVGLRDAGWAEAREGVQAGETVVRRGHLRLSDGDKVSMADAKSAASGPGETGSESLTSDGGSETGQEDSGQ
ncbi:MAG: efflux RND transporter periplasmic adaptor subunit [Pirellulaceae bacterium]